MTRIVGFEGALDSYKYLFQALLSQLEDNVMNASSKAVSSEVICAKNQVSIEQLQTRLESSLKDFENRLVRDETSLKILQKPVPVPLPVPVSVPLPVSVPDETEEQTATTKVA